MRKKTDFDVLIFGGGPAGVSASVWADEMGLTSALIDRGSALGGQLFNVHNCIKNYPGAEFKNGAELAGALTMQFKRLSTALLLNREVICVDVGSRTLTLEDRTMVSGRSLILATGVRRARLNVPGESKFSGKGILDSGAKEPAKVSAKHVVIVGGGDAALENALLLSRYARSVIVVHRRHVFSARPEFVDQLRNIENIEVIFDSEVMEFLGEGSLKGVRIRKSSDSSERSIAADHALVRIGFEPNSELFRDQVNCDRRGHVIVDQHCRTGRDGTYAVGDVSRPFSQTIAGAVGDGATSAIFIYREFARLKEDGPILSGRPKL